jgi:hypothetical protein
MKVMTNSLDRQENETVVRLKGMCPDNRIPQGLLSEGGTALQNGLKLYEIYLLC